MPDPTLSISVVIPTRDRAPSLDRTLAALGRQQRRPDEVLIVDAGDPPLAAEALRTAHPELAIRLLRSRPGVCVQRNLGIRQAAGSHVLLCDDDIEPPPDYLGRLVGFLEQNPRAGAATGTIRERTGENEYTRGFVAPSLRHLLVAFAFQLTVWADVEAARSGALGRLPLRLLKRWYRRRGNTWSLAGWPLVTQVRGPAFRTATYGLGAALVRRDWLLASPYDERLGEHGIGDNYGVALGFPGEHPIAVINDLPVLHHRDATNRLDPAAAYLQRVLALDYFLQTSRRFSGRNRLFLAWSLVGKTLLAAARGKGALVTANLRAFAIVVGRRNPLLRERS